MSSLNRWVLIVGTVAGLCGAVVAPAQAASVAEAASYWPTFGPFAPPAGDGEVPGQAQLSTAGHFALFVSETEQPNAPVMKTLTLDDQLTNTVDIWTISDQCEVGLGPTRLLQECGASVRSFQLTARVLASGRQVSLGTRPYSLLGNIGAVGRDWAEQGAGAYYLNLETGELAHDRAAASNARGRLYPDLDSPTLFHTVCQPVSVSSPYPGLISDVFVFGNRTVTIDATDRLRLQRCGTSKRTTIASSRGAVTNGKVFVWARTLPTGRYEIDGLTPSTGQRFVINLPQALQDPAPDGIWINDDAIFVRTQDPNTGGLLTSYDYETAALPTALR